LLPLELLFEGGHLSDVAVSTLADGEEALLPPEVRKHAHECATCAATIQKEALHSVAVGEILRAAAEPELAPASAALEPVRAPVPWVILAVGCFLSVLGVVLGSVGSSTSIADMFRNLRGFAALVSRVGRALWRADVPPTISFASTALLLVFAFVVIRYRPLKGGVGGPDRTASV
jgi:hypothetical protein